MKATPGPTAKSAIVHERQSLPLRGLSRPGRLRVNGPEGYRFAGRNLNGFASRRLRSVRASRFYFEDAKPDILIRLPFFKWQQRR